MSQVASIASPKTKNLQAQLQIILDEAGVQLNGSQPWDIKVHNENFYERVLKEHSLGAGESYMDGWWDCDQLDALFDRILSADLETKIKQNWGMILRNLINLTFNAQTIKLSKKVAEKHYNLDNEMYRYMLGETMAYTCAYWKDADNLDQAQNQKYDLVCRKLDIKDTDTVLELGCGWGGFARYASTKYGCKVVAVNISSEQIKFAKTICEHLPVELYLTDYRDFRTYNPQLKQFDKIVSIGLCEHVGRKNYANFMQIAHQNLKSDGLFLLHTIGSDTSRVNTDEWTNKYIFPNGMLPSIKQLGTAMEHQFVMEDWHNFGAYYDKTLMAWYQNFQLNWPRISHKFDQRFYRMWSYYLLCSAGMFRSRTGQLWQIVLSPKGVRGGYISIR